MKWWGEQREKFRVMRSALLKDFWKWNIIPFLFHEKARSCWWAYQTHLENSLVLRFLAVCVFCTLSSVCQLIEKLRSHGTERTLTPARRETMPEIFFNLIVIECGVNFTHWFYCRVASASAAVPGTLFPSRNRNYKWIKRAAAAAATKTEPSRIECNEKQQTQTASRLYDEIKCVRERERVRNVLQMRIRQKLLNHYMRDAPFKIHEIHFLTVCSPPLLTEPPHRWGQLLRHKYEYFTALLCTEPGERPKIVCIQQQQH
jgi:hypothetical protein